MPTRPVHAANTKGLICLVAAIVSEVTGSLSLRAAIDQSGWYALVVVAYLVAFTLLAATLRTGVPVGVAYGLWAAGGVALTAIMSLVVFGEPITLVMGVGIVLVIVGVLLIEMGSGGAHRRVDAERPA